MGEVGYKYFNNFYLTSGMDQEPFHQHPSFSKNYYLASIVHKEKGQEIAKFSMPCEKLMWIEYGHTKVIITELNNKFPPYINRNKK